MAPTPSSDESPASTSGPGLTRAPDSSQSKIRRNVACISCRDSKVRCRASPVTGQPCQRCAKLQIPKLELLEQELRSIKEVVQPKSNAESPSVSQRNGTVFPIQPSQLPPATNGTVFSLSSNLQSPQQPQSFVPSATLLEKTEPTKPRMLGGKLVSGQDIDWYFENILAQRVSTGNGHPPPFLQHNDTKCKDTIKDTLAPELLTFFELQKFSNRLHTAMSAQISANNGVPETIVKMWEAEFELLRPLVTHVETDFSRFIMLVAQLEVQAYYYISPPDQRPNFTLNTLRTYNTSQNLINTALTLESTCQLLTHSPHWVYRALVDASCILLSTLHSTAAPQHLSSSDAEVVAAQVLSLLKTCSVRDNDLPTRGSIILETFWSVRHLLPKWDIPVGAWPDRIGAATSYWCLTAFKNALQEAKNITDGTQKGIDAFQQRFPGSNGDNNESNVNANTDINGQEQTMDSAIDPLQGIDWSMIIDDFGWIGEGPVFLGPA
ncbi:hypothetical protein FocTR4_00012918 [Fusarium oxysporum f. sp. cubense]|uniref:Zn(2)-C6 fungal-type domain-containing protein n=1 Tax=Fusarium oxysporum f. sp. cubense TaxID=61366 RepID=A0A5C6SMK5_FUSOC|nr:hypothetical protein FocTR4_00012918 [Fusarium oxysporum f. sp. cubense]